jgi:heat shock protein HslJ
MEIDPMRPTLKLAFIPLALGFALVAAGCDMIGGGGGGLTGKTWQWTASTTTVPASQSVTPDPENYTVEFNSDGTFSAKVDCNQVAGSYTTSGSDLTIVPGPSTLVACPEGSAADIYLAILAGTTSYQIEGGQLVLTTADGTATFDAS